MPLSLALLCRDFASTPSTPALSTFGKPLHIFLTGRFLLRTIIMLPQCVFTQSFHIFHQCGNPTLTFKPSVQFSCYLVNLNWAFHDSFQLQENLKTAPICHLFTLERNFFQSHFLHANFLSLSVEQCGKYLKPKEKNALTSLQLSPFSSRNQHFPVRPETFQMIEIIKQTSKVI